MRQSGFTLVEIAIVLVIIGLLLGGVLKGQELINSAKVKNFAQDFRTIPLFVYGYQDRFRALPGDDPAANTHINGANNATTPAGAQGNGVINGGWNTRTLTDESWLFWQHVRLANLAAGATTFGAAYADGDPYIARNTDGGRIGIQGAANPPIAGMTGTYIVCSNAIQGRFVRQLDQTLDDGQPNTGSMRAVLQTSMPDPFVPGTSAAPAAANAITDGDSYTVCFAF